MSVSLFVCFFVCLFVCLFAFSWSFRIRFDTLWHKVAFCSLKGSKTIILKTISCSYNAYNKIKEKDENNIEPLYYTNRNDKRIERVEDIRTKKAKWYKVKEQNGTVIFIPTTPLGVARIKITVSFCCELKRKMKEVIERAEVKIAITEVPGRNIKQILQRSDPFIINKCRNSDECFVCKHGESGVQPIRRARLLYIH